MLLVSVALMSLAIGVVLGMLGGGGAILLLPTFVYVAGVETKTAIAMSLFVMGVVSTIATAVQARTGNVRWKTGLVLAGGGMAGAFAGGHIARFVPSSALLAGFGIVMLVTAVAMFRRREDGRATVGVSPVLALALGVPIGLISGLVGAGGGFLIVPALTLVAGLKMREAVATSLFVIAAQSFAGFAGHASHVTLDWSLVAASTLAAAVGAVAGSVVTKRVRPEGLRRALAILVAAMGTFVIAQQV